MLNLPQTAEYALRAIYFMAEAPPGQPVRVGEISSALKVPRNYLSKTLYQLARAGVLRSTRGPRGGFQLAKPPARLTLAEVVGPFLPPQKRCVLGRATCSDAAPCAAHWRWKEIAERMGVFFGGTTIADLLVPPLGAQVRRSPPPEALPRLSARYRPQP